jgi:hypothetical protein
VPYLHGATRILKGRILMATRKIILEDGERIYRNAIVNEDRGTLFVVQDVEDNPFRTSDNVMPDTLAQYPPETWKYWETIEE